MEAHNRHGAFHPLTERTAQWTTSAPQTLLQHLQRDLTAHTGGRLSDDVAFIALHRARRAGERRYELEQAVNKAVRPTDADPAE
ncbi:hypothetical protein ACWER6_29390 [Streptomyces sp. NPDC004009]